jgi:hypothetical protein
VGEGRRQQRRHTSHNAHEGMQATKEAHALRWLDTVVAHRCHDDHREAAHFRAQLRPHCKGVPAQHTHAGMHTHAPTHTHRNEVARAQHTHAHTHTLTRAARHTHPYNHDPPNRVKYAVAGLRPGAFAASRAEGPMNAAA